MTVTIWGNTVSGVRHKERSKGMEYNWKRGGLFQDYRLRTTADGLGTGLHCIVRESSGNYCPGGWEKV